MAEENEAVAGAANEGQKPPQINVMAQYIKDLSFENPAGIQSLRSTGQNPEMKVEVNVNARPLDPEQGIFESELTISAKAATGETELYQLEVVYGGAVRLTHVPEEHLRPVLLINCPSLFFPFARRIIADLTREGGFPPLFLDPIDFAGLFQRNQTRMSDAEPNGSAA